MMNKLFRKKLTRGGFTLAELLIVVAILAVLVAIAIPVFSGSLKDARESVFDAGIRSAKSAGVAFLLRKANEDELTAGITNGWNVVAHIGPDGTMDQLSVKGCKAVSDKITTDGVADAQIKLTADGGVDSSGSSPTAPSTAAGSMKTSSGFWVAGHITPTDVTT